MRSILALAMLFAITQAAFLTRETHYVKNIWIADLFFNSIQQLFVFFACLAYWPMVLFYPGTQDWFMTFIKDMSYNSFVSFTGSKDQLAGTPY